MPRPIGSFFWESAGVCSEFVDPLLILPTNGGHGYEAVCAASKTSGAS